MGQVFLASARGPAGFEKVVALKMIGAQKQRDAALISGLLREAMIGVRLDHENVVQVLDCGEDAGHYFVAMEYVRGFTLSRIIRHSFSQPIPVGIAAYITRTLATALDYVHNFADEDGAPLGLIHGDVSPSNVLVAADGRIKLADFGVAALAHETSARDVIVGKLPYLPPEGFSDTPQTQNWDVYALGAVFYELLVGRRAFAGRDVAAIQAAHRAGPPPLTRPDCSRLLADVISRAIARDPSDRYPSAAAFRHAIDQAAPRRVDDADVHRTYVSVVYADEAFVAANGPLTPVGARGGVAALQQTYADQIDTSTVGGGGTSVTPSALRFGLTPAVGVDRARAGGERLARHLAARLRRTVRPIVLGDYQTLVDALANGEVDIAWTPPAAFASAADRGASAIAVCRRHGETSYESAIIVRADSTLRGLHDLRGKRMGWVDMQSASGYLFAAAEIVRVLGQLDRALGKQHFFGSHREACEALANGWCDAAATYVVRSGEAIVSGGWIDALGDRASEIRPIAFSIVIPGDSIAARPQLPDATRADVLAGLLAMNDDAEGRAILADVFGAEGFVRLDTSAYQTVRARLRLL